MRLTISKILKHIKEFEEDFDASLNDCIVKLFGRFRWRKIERTTTHHEIEHRESHWEESAKKKGLEWCEVRFIHCGRESNC